MAKSFKLDFLFETNEFFQSIGFTINQASIANHIIGIGLIILIAWIADFVSKKIMVAWIEQLAKKSSTVWDDIFVEKKLFNRLAHLAPALVFYYSLNYIIPGNSFEEKVLKSIVLIYMIVAVLMVITSFLSGIEDIYKTTSVAKDRPIKGFIQIAKIIFYFMGIILIISIIIGESPLKLFAGLGAIAAVLLLVFKDTILGFVASIQLSANNMLRIGDWISMPKHNADGTVIEITLNTVKVQNWDKTIATVPTYALVSESFTNWRGMEESGGRRIKRHINIDMNSVCFLTTEQKEKFKSFFLLKDYMLVKEKEIADYNQSLGVDDTVVVNGRRMTNLGTFRKYLEAYLKNHPKIHNDMTFLVRQLQPGETGIPIEIYVFSNDQVWANYETVQADIFDHILAILPQFGLRVFQNPSGADFIRFVS
ncbi:MAG: mechanosensitive ion channel [Bacteroidales bacterium]|nr:mechanosensitive ion channel [Bacteroidales bacterium]